MTVIHPARYSPAILDALAGLVPAGARVHDPFAGTGERLGALADERGWTFSGTEIERSFIVDPRVVEGDATERGTYPTEPYYVVTSPVYPNGLADHFQANDGTRRNTYRQAIADIEGADRPLHDRNMGAWGYRGTKRHGKSLRRQAYWRLARWAAEAWAATPCVAAVVNVKNFESEGAVEPFVQDYAHLLMAVGFRITDVVAVRTPGLRLGANHDRRLGHEVVMKAIPTTT